jgi:ubiquinone/menaquinone biosynthesis C-methylase UbiE
MDESKAILDPEKLLQACDIKNKEDVADFGCGPGIFSIPIARMTEGIVYCFDVLESALEAVDSRAQIMGINNIVTRRANLEKIGGSGLEDGVIEHVIMRKILLQNDNKEGLFAEAYRILTNNGKLLVVGWDKNVIKGFGTNNRLDKKEIKDFATKAGFINTIELDAGDYHYAFIFIK